MLVGRGVGGVVGVLAFLATWIFCIARFGLVFGASLGWIPGAVVGMVLSAVVSWLWLPLVLAAVVVVSAPAWDKGGVVKKATAQTLVVAARGWKKADAWLEKVSDWTRDQAARDGLTTR